MKKKLCLKAPRRLVLIVSANAQNAVDFVNEDEGGLLNACNGEKTLIEFVIFNRRMKTDERTLTIFSPSPIHLEVRELADMLKKVRRASVATAFAIIVCQYR